MSAIETGEFKQRLLDERRRLQEAVENLQREHRGSLEDETQELSISDNHPGDVATETFDRELDGGLQEGATRQLEQIDAALARIEAGTYGTCTACGKPVAAERLRAVPWAILCIDDQRRQEQG
jgi:RNA polymerase-binding protein DksA